MRFGFDFSFGFSGLISKVVRNGPNESGCRGRSSGTARLGTSLFCRIWTTVGSVRLGYRGAIPAAALGSGRPFDAESPIRLEMRLSSSSWVSAVLVGDGI